MHFEHRGHTVVFSPAPLEHGETTQMLTFMVDNDPALTARLMDAIATTRVRAKSTEYFAKVLFDTLKSSPLILAHG